MRHEQTADFRLFKSEREAYSWMKTKNAAHRRGDKEIFAVVEHPEGWAVLDLRTAIDSDLRYSWAC